jgi:hypothetical protein
MNDSEERYYRDALRYEKVCVLPLQSPSASKTPLLRSLAFAPGGSYLAGAFDRYIQVWKVKKMDDDPFERVDSMMIYRLDDRSTGEEITFMTWTTADFLLTGTNAGDVKVIKVTEEVSRVFSC